MNSQVGLVEKVKKHPFHGGLASSPRSNVNAMQGTIGAGFFLFKSLPSEPIEPETSATAKQFEN